MPHEPALDGLRGAAVLAVLLFHGGYLTGGYLGVDAFFVLSGYLITSLLLLEVSTTGSVSLLAFWGRRLRRLLPALVLVLMAVAAWAAIAAPVDQLHTIRADALATLGYFANWRQIALGNDYWAIFGSPSPLQHTWSLAIEEQFYLIWPLVILLLCRRRSRNDAARRTLVLSVTLAAISFAAMQVLAASDNTRIYYGTDTRATSILIGAALAAWSTLRPRWVSGSGRRVLEVVAIGAIGFLGIAWTQLDGASMRLARGGLLLSAIATATIIAAATHERRGPVAEVLSIPPLRWLGLISYGAYLWHWPIYVVFDEARTGLHGWALLAVRLGVTFAISVLSYRIVEQPIRSARPAARSRLLILAPAAVIVTVVAVVTATVVPSPSVSVADVGKTPTGPPVRVLVAGDSVALTLVRGQQAAAARLGVSIDFAGNIGCGISPGDRKFGGAFHPAFATCSQWAKIFRRQVDAFDPDVAVLYVGVWELFDLRVNGIEYRFGTAAFQKRLLRQLEQARAVLSARGAKVALVTASCYRPALKVFTVNPILADERRVDAYNAILARFAADHADDVTLVDLHDYLCPGGKYRESIGGRTLRFDGVHLTASGALDVWTWLAPRLRAVADAPG